jgi:hypothetical protein
MIGLRVDKLNFSGLFVEVRFKRTDSSIGFRAGSDQRPTLTSLLVRPSGLLYCFLGHLLQMKVDMRSFTILSLGTSL